MEAADQVPNDLDRRIVGPVEVVEHEDRRLLRREALEQRADRVMGAVALARKLRRGGRGGRHGERRQQRRELGHGLLTENGEHRLRQRARIVVERVDHDAERQPELELGGAAVEHEVVPRLRPSRKLEQQARLADPRLPENLDRPRLAGREPVECALQLGDLHGATDQRVRPGLPWCDHPSPPAQAYVGPPAGSRRSGRSGALRVLRVSD